MGLRKSSFLSFVLGVLFVNFAFAEQNLDSSLESNCTSISATGNSEYPPFIWQSHTEPSQLIGAIRHIMDELSKRIDIPLSMTHSGLWSQAQSDVRNGEKDLLAGAFYTNERANYMEYFMPIIFHTRSVVWQNKQHLFTFNTKEDLEGKWGVTVINNSFGEEFDSYARRRLNILTVSSVQKALELLVNSKVDYFLYEKNPATAYVDLLNLSGQVIPAEPHISSEGIYLTLSKKSPCNTPLIKQKIEMALVDMKREGFINEAILKGSEDWHLQ
ncbi:transporter substrate-binding domain-containing protein [Marinomonas sp. C2222]|uniref:Transporter substrate-binding domain-containing protein n=1 Tax=Marinomonas sargassi TaxID=2984494 RepID=A0ABT2YVE4_9GAMM|nr:transporter substrate-binding domain-containing protein [Marinomonas sargassi]MCV2403846.1 transporter substrate-binding domain-containing protein [Marinomonas sargassi]